MRKPFAKIEQHLANQIDQELMTEIHSFRSERLLQIADIIQEMSSTLNRLSGIDALQEAIGEGIEQLQNFLKNGEFQGFHNHLISNIFVLQNEFPKRIIFEQLPECFQALPEDPWYTKAGKAGKKLIRRMGKSEWMQKIPAQRVVAYHLLDADWFFKDWLSAEERLIMQIILEFDQVLANTSRSDLQKVNDTELQQLLQVVKNYIEEARRSQKQELAEARGRLVNEILAILPKVGTFEKPAGFYSEQRLLRKKEQTQKELSEYREKWKKINSELLQRTTVLYRFILFCEDLRKSTETFKTEIRGLFNRVFFTPFDELEHQITSVRQQVINSEQYLFSVLTDEDETLQINLDNQLLEPLRNCIEQEEFQQRVDSYAEELRKRTDGLSETAVFITDLNRKKDPPTVKFREVPWQMLVDRAIKEKLIKDITPIGERMRKFSDQQLNELQELKDFIQVNLESALKLTRDQSPQDNPYAVADDALKRGRLKIEDSYSEARKTEKELLEPLDIKISDFRRTMFDLLHQADTNKLKMLDAQHRAFEKAEDWKTKLKTGWGRLQDRGAAIARFVRIKTRPLFTDTGFRLGLTKEETPQEKSADIAAYLSETERKINELPYIYRRLFDFKSVTDKQYYVALNENFNVAREAYSQWEKGISTSFAVVGEKGSGKSTYLKFLKEDLLAERTVLRIDLEHTLCSEKELLNLFDEKFDDTCFSTIDELASFLKQRKERTVIIFGGIHNAYIRNLNGYEAIEKFIYLISETGEQIFWLISCSRYAWAYLDEAFSFGAYFTYLVKTDELNKHQIENAIMKRHRASGYEAVFTASENDAENRFFKKLQSDEKRQEYLKEKYFSALAKISSGNASIAMIFWIRSIQKFDENHCYVEPLELAILEMLEELTTKMQFVLAALVLHDRLKPEELARTQNMSVEESRLILNRLTGKGIVFNSEQGFAINHLMYRHVIEKLKELNILHLG